MQVSRRDFFRYCGLTAAALGLGPAELGLLRNAVANPASPTVIWLHGSGCTGCSVSFLNRISTAAPATAADVLISSINLAFHPTVMAAAGEDAAMVVDQAYRAGGYVLVVEGAVPMAYSGAACWVWGIDGVDVTMLEAVYDLAKRAAKVICVGNCSCYGGMPAAGPNTTQIQSVRSITGVPTINIAGCPPHPDWIVWPIVQILLGAPIELDGYGRPKVLYGKPVHERCPRKEAEKARRLGEDNRCMKEIGCRGPKTKANCPTIRWNNGVNWCVDANAPCYGCTEPGFPFTPIVPLGEAH